MTSIGVLRDAKPIAWQIVGSLIACHITVKWVVFRPAFYSEVASPLFNLTAGVLTPSVVAGFVQFASIGLLLLLLARGFDWSSLGLTAGRLWSAVPVVFLIWSIAQAVVVVVIAGSGGLGRYFALWQMPAGVVAGSFAEAFVTSAFVEEVFYRGLLMPQAFLLLRTRTRTSRSALVLAALVSQGYFALMHIPSAVRMGLAPGSAGFYLCEVFLVGLLFVVIYLVTDNLFIAVGIHGLLNLPAPIFEPAPAAVIILVTALLMMMAWPAIRAATETELSPVRSRA